MKVYSRNTSCSLSLIYTGFLFTKNKTKKHTEIDQQFGTFTLVEMKKYKSSNFEQWTPFLSLEPRCNSGVNK
jgi:hypothetical protein